MDSIDFWSEEVCKKIGNTLGTFYETDLSLLELVSYVMA